MEMLRLLGPILHVVTPSAVSLRFGHVETGHWSLRNSTSHRGVGLMDLVGIWDCTWRFLAIRIRIKDRAIEIANYHPHSCTAFLHLTLYRLSSGQGARCAVEMDEYRVGGNTYLV